MKHTKDEDEGYDVLHQVDDKGEVRVGLTQNGIFRMKHSKVYTFTVGINISKEPDIIEERQVTVHIEYINNRILAQVKEEHEESIKRTSREILARDKREKLKEKHKAADAIPELLEMDQQQREEEASGDADRSATEQEAEDCGSHEH